MKGLFWDCNTDKIKDFIRNVPESKFYDKMDCLNFGGDWMK